MLQVAFWARWRPSICTRAGRRWNTARRSRSWPWRSISTGWPPAVRRCLREPERHRHHLHGDHRAHDLRDGAQRHLAQDIRPVHPRFGIPRPAMWFNLIVSFIFLFFFRGWGKLAAVISVATIITYLVVPISVIVLRRTAPDLHRPLRVPGLHVLAPMAFVLATLMLFWARWPHTGEIMLLLILPLPVYLYYQGEAGWPISAGSSRRLVVDRLSAGDDWIILGRQQGIRRPRLYRLRLGSAVRRVGRIAVLCLGREQRLAYAGNRGCGTQSGNAGFHDLIPARQEGNARFQGSTLLDRTRLAL
jgi:hypothetical protein